MLPTASSTTPNFLVTAASPDLVQLDEPLRAKDWETIYARVASATADDQSYLLNLVASLADEDTLATWAEQEGSVFLDVLIATRHILEGWQVRTDARAEHVTPAQWKTFRERLVVAERMLIRATATAPSYAPAWVSRLLSARGLGLGQSEARRRYEQLTRTHPHHYWGQTQLLQQLCPKWGGSWEEMHTFARECTQASPAGSINGTLVAKGHLEHYLELPPGERHAYLASADVQRELIQAAEKSVLHPDFGQPYGWVQAQGNFALCFSLMGAYDKAAPHFERLGDLASKEPWSYTGDPAKVFLGHRAKALGKGNRK